MFYSNVSYYCYSAACGIGLSVFGVGGVLGCSVFCYVFGCLVVWSVILAIISGGELGYFQVLLQRYSNDFGGWCLVM